MAGAFAFLIELNRVCSHCGVMKPMGMFAASTSSSGIKCRTRKCRRCINAIQIERHGDWTKVNKERHRESVSRYTKTPKGWSVRAITNVRRRAKEDSVPCDVTTDDIAEVFPQDSLCPALRTPLKHGPQNPGNCSIDRIRPDVGYVRGNIVILSKEANGIKQDASPDEIDMVADWLERELSEE